MEMERDAYLSRISVVRDYSFSLSREGLELLQARHLETVPFENLDIHWKRPIILDTNRFYEKIVADKRGGFCYELNGLFETQLRSMGFETRLVSARPFSKENGFGPEFDHVAIIVSIGQTEYLVDVGFGDFAAGPLKIVVGEEQMDREGTFRIRKLEEVAFVVEKKSGDEWRTEYMFGLKGRNLAEFSDMCDFQQFSPESHFTKGKICSVLTNNGRKTLTDRNFIVTTNGDRVEMPVRSEAEFNDILSREFGIRQKEEISI
jgi:N-hydroxyarylamine O-acetyltransferase